MKILYIITGLAQGGAERVVCDLADAMCAKGHTVKIAYLTGSVLTKPKSEAIELIPINLKGVKGLPFAYFKISQVIRSYRPDVVHSHMVHANILTRLVKLSVPIKKLISTAHSNNEGGRERMLAYRLTHKLADLTTNVSKAAVLSFERKKAVPKKGMMAVYNGIDLSKFYFRPKAREKLVKELNLNNTDNILLAVGRFNELKDYPNLFQAIHRLKQRSSIGFKLIVAGDGEQRLALEKIIQSLSLENDVILLGRRSDIPELMSAADLFILPSKYEGFGLVVAEAMACRCLVVATDSGGVSEVLNNNEFLVPPSNPDLLAMKIDFALNLDKPKKLDIINKNLIHVEENFSLSSITDTWVELYNA